MMKLSSEVPNFCRRIYKKSRRLIDLSGCWQSGFRHPATSTIKAKRPARNRRAFLFGERRIRIFTYCDSQPQLDSLDIGLDI